VCAVHLGPVVPLFRASSLRSDVISTIKILSLKGYANLLAKLTMLCALCRGMHVVGFLAKKDVNAIAAWEKFVFPP